MNHMEESDYLSLLDSFDGEMMLFFLFLKMGEPLITKKVSRACVVLHQSGKIEMMINPDFWKKLTYYEKKFVIAHELLHVYYSHMQRMYMMGDMEKANIAADIVVNETLVKVFGFDRVEIRFHNQLCWRDTIFGSKEISRPINTFEHYYKRLISGEGTKKNTLDNHSGDEGYPSDYIDGETASHNLQNEIGYELSKMDSETLEKLKAEVENIDSELMGDGEDDDPDENPVMQAGKGIGHAIRSYEYKVDYFHYFKSVIDRWLNQFEFEKVDDQFIYTEPYLELVSEKMLVPSEDDIDDVKFEKNRLWVYVDASGSCSNYLEDFIKVCGGIPEEHFDIQFFSFTTQVRPIKRDKDNKLVLKDIFGGTTFSCIDHHIKKTTAKGDIKKPDNVFVMTDGLAPKIKIKSTPPERWHFFIMPSRKTNIFTQFIPNGAIIHNFRDIK